MAQLQPSATEPPVAESSRSPLRLGRLSLHVLVVALVTVLLLWTIRSDWQWPRPAERQIDYYNSLVRGMLAGTLALDIEVPQALKECEDPWDPDKRPRGIAPADVSYKDGRYYLYFGVVPALVLFLPYRLITGLEFPAITAMAAFVVLAYWLHAYVWLSVVRRYFPRVGPMTRVGGLIALGLAGGLLVLSRRTGMWEMPIAAGQMFLAAALAATWNAWHATRPRPWLALAGLFFGLALGCRPTLIAAAGGLVLLSLGVAFSRRLGEARPAWKRVFAAALSAGWPLAAILAILLWYNYARFGSPFEFGLNYQLTAVNERVATHFSLGFLRYNLELYALAPPNWNRYFPFLLPVSVGAPPPRYFAAECTYGIIYVCPLVFWVVGLVLIGRWRDRPMLLWLVAWQVITLAGVFGLLLAFNTAAARYMADFLPWWVWLSLLGWLAVDERLCSWGRVASIARSAFAATFAAAGALAFCWSAQLHDVLPVIYPRVYDRIERICNAPTAWTERLLGAKTGPIEMEVTFVHQPGGTFEPLLESGVEHITDYVFVHHLGDGRIQLGYVSSGRGARVSDPVEVEMGRPYGVRVEFAGLYPPSNHPIFAGWEAFEIAGVKRWVTLSIDGTAVLEVFETSHVPQPSHLTIGTTRGTGTFGRQFSGEIRSVRRLGIAPAPAREHARTGEHLLQVRLPALASPVPEPLLVVGWTGRADIVGLQMLDAGSCRLTYESWGRGLWHSPAIPVRARQDLTIRIAHGPTLGFAEVDTGGRERRSLVVWFGDELVWVHPVYGDIPENAPVHVGVNSIGSTASSAAFSGRIRNWSRRTLVDWPTDSVYASDGN
jgi:hypothetical protein